MSATVTTTRSIDLAKLTGDLGGVGLTMAEVDADRTITCHDDTVTQEQLEAAVDAHVPAPPPPNTEALLQQQINELTDLILFGL